MVSKHIVFFLLLLIIPDLYIYWYNLKYRASRAWWKMLLLFCPTVVMLLFTAYLYPQKGYMGENPYIFEIYLLLVGLLVAPKAAYTLCSSIGHLCCRLTRKRQNWGNLLGLLLSIYCIYVVVYGCTVGIKRLKVKDVEVAFTNLPAEFDGYKIALFSDAHVGTFRDSRINILEKIIDTINLQKPDLVVFAGDLQNVEPQELYPCRTLLNQLQARDGVISVLGNHDYSYYSDASPVESVANERELQSLQRQCGWNLLMNSNKVIHRQQDSLVIAGLENHGKEQKTEELKRRCPQRGNVEEAMKGIDDDAFVIMVEHDPSAWRELIIPKTKAQLTLSGHTHGGQVRLFGFSPTDIVYSESRGLYWENQRALYVTSGVGGLIPMRFGVKPEIVIITLRQK